MYFHGEISELDREEFANLRKRLTRALDAVAKHDSGMAEVANAIRQIVEESEIRAEERASEERTPENIGSEERVPTQITDDVLDSLQKDLDSLDADSFLEKI